MGQSDLMTTTRQQSSIRRILHRLGYRKKLKRIDAFQVITILGLIVFSLFMILPVLFIINHAFKPINELFLYPPTFFAKKPTLFNIKELLLRPQVIPFSRYLFNSLITTVLTVSGVIMISAMAAYAFSKHHFPGKNVLFSIIILALMFAPEAVGIPRYLVMANLNMLNTYFVHIVPFFAAPMAVFLMKQFIDQIPGALMEAAKIDGAKEWTILFRIVIPVCMPAVATVGILAFQGAWTNVESSNLFTQVESMKTLPYYIASLLSGASNNVVGQGAAAAGGLLIFLPTLVVFLFFQRKILMTMAHSGIK
ncbi:carbohydrate ABC transporter permease [Paenibacillus eucommiae]|uniref:ABC-type glycerol-3-phosphate transport system permease component n=1 Tax=Paenibacillus eucommiae TaxID=1355755 RepID=A0ABS4INK1_9BACL|nr:carbohydrate ABC transporter permease [Paenibacillus eucommiae]MBP1988606.1 ABC-type glycerol-3-phosphate transport system permease component [Paenibacillus eucommiae]